MRIETDAFGNKEIPDNALYGIHSVRALINFPYSSAFPKPWYEAMGWVKRACYLTIRDFKKSALEQNPKINLPFPDDTVIDAMEQAAIEVSEGKFMEHFIVPALQGGAGTSINMNINEIITNRALQYVNKPLGDYSVIDPIETANLYQSTNDVVPTALKLAILKLLPKLENEINQLRQVIEQLEKKYQNTLRIGYTQMQEAVPTTYGRLFSTYSEALSRDWWRVSKCFERIKTVNLGGGAIGTGLAIPRYFILNVTRQLHQITGLPVSRSENLQDATANNDSFTEIHAILKAHAVNLEKMTSDIRLLASNIANPELIIPSKQTGSSIMPGKVNPVIVEYTVNAAHKIYSNDNLISALCGMGCLELNAYLPGIGVALIESIQILIAANETLRLNLFEGLVVDPDIALNKVIYSASVVTALNPVIGYHKASLLANEMKQNKISVFEANQKLQLIAPQKLEELLEPQNLLKLGFSINEL